MDFIILKVNGQDLSNSTHEEAVQAFHNAQEPIVVEVLRRVNKNKMKHASPIMVSIGTQTEEELYGCPPTPPPPILPFPASGLYEPSNRRPFALSASSEMGLTDIEMAHGYMEYDDAYYEDRCYDLEYEEVLLRRSSVAEKLGLTLCYGSLEDSITDIFISEVEPNSIAAKTGRIKQGDQILQINGVDVQNRDQAIQLFKESRSDICLLLSRPQCSQQNDDGFLDGGNIVIDDIQMELLERRHHSNMQIMASMLSRGLHEEEGGTTDTGMTENSHKHEKDSGVGRTDESLKYEESSEQDFYDTECSPFAHHTYQVPHGATEHIYSEVSYVSNPGTDRGSTLPEIPAERCEEFRHHLEQRFLDHRNASGLRKDSHSSAEHELDNLNHDLEGLNVDYEEIDYGDKPKPPGTPARQRGVVPRMGTRLEYMKQVSACDSSDKEGSLTRYNRQEKDTSTTSAYNTGESCRSTPLTLELSQACEQEGGDIKSSMLCLAPTPLMSALSDTEKQTQTPCRSQDSSSEDTFLTNTPTTEVSVQMPREVSASEQKQMGESLQDLYMQYADVMYTNKANLQHTIQIQQKLFQQQLERKRGLGVASVAGSNSSGSSKQSPSQTGNATNSEGGQMEWVVKRRPDGTRYITRRPVRSKMLKERAKKITEERCGMTTDDDAMSELKTGRYWPKEDRKKHLEKAKDQKKRRELMAKAKLDTLKESEEKKEPNIVDLSHKKMLRHKNKKALDNFVTIQEMLTHGSRVADGKNCNPLLSVTTV